jgi:oxygen-independent coproporphyrinogen-3 oxidase
VPFCAHRCDYCDFATWTDRAHLIDDYVAACVGDIERRDLPPATSVFFGGGTPSLLPAQHLVRILDAIPRHDGAETTVECNPDSVDATKLGAYARAGVNRLSFGVQSMRPHVLAALNRTHDPANVERAVALARDAGFDNLNVDLIYGTPGESIDDWRTTLDTTLALGTEHVSAYALTVEPNTPLGRDVAAGRARPPDDDDQADKYVLADEVLGAHGMAWYEISNWSLPGRECRHNRCYWDGSDYVGIGCAAHGFTGGRRWWNTRTPERYVERIAAGRSPETGDERLDPAARAEEAFSLALRTRDGARFAAPAGDEVRDLAAAGLCDVPAPGVVTLTRPGRLLASDVTARLLLAGAANRGAEAGGAAAAVSTRYH